MNMKKTYYTPATEVLELQADSVILSGSVTPDPYTPAPEYAIEGEQY